MTTLDSIGYTVAVGFGVSLLSFTSFGLALRLRSINIAPRCTARHPDTIFNFNAGWSKVRKVKDNDGINGSEPREVIQYRGNCIWGWIPWALSLSYETLLNGVPGTGTRKRGAEGSMLKVNLDGIIMIKFHAMCLKVALLATVLCIGICLPINFSVCFSDDNTTKACSRRERFGNMTNFEKTTLAAIPQIIPGDNIFASTIAPSTLLARFYTIVLVAWLLYFYIIRLLQREWIENLALRRVYYLEADHWGDRMDDLRDVELSDSDSDNSLDEVKQKSNPQTHTKRKRKLKLNYRNSRDPWIPHPEMRETVPNIDLFSVLVGNLPSSLAEILYDPEDTLAQNLTKKDIVLWQLNVTAAFFDRCVPRPPGFSSSVAAVTILPDAPDLANAWRKWYQHAVMVRKLRLVRSLLARMQHFEINDVLGDNDVKLHDHNNLFGSQVDGDCLDGNVLHLDEDNLFGPEQAAAYARESAEGAAAICTYGCCEERVRASNIHNLSALERQMALRAEQTYENLKTFQSIYVKKTMDAINDGADIHRSDHIISEGLNLTAESHRLSRLMKQKQKILAAGSNIPISDEETSLQRGFHSLDLSNTSIITALDESVGVGFHRPSDIHIEENNYLGRISIDLGNENNSLRLRLNTDWSHMSAQSSTGIKKESQWNKVQRLVQNESDAMGTRPRKVDDGVWGKVDLKSLLVWIGSRIKQWAGSKTKAAVRNVIGESNFAVVTFTSRQAALAARKCLADGRGYNRFRIIDEHPIPPLADAAICDITDFRGCCRPVTITHSSKLQFARKFIARTIIVGMYIFWAVPIQFAVSLVDLKQLYAIWPFLENVAKDNPFLNRLISGFLPALLFSSFFAIAPHIFRALANFGSNAISIYQAEYFAMKYYWWFMLITAFSLGSSIATIILNAINERQKLDRLIDGQIWTGVLAQVAKTLPTQVSATWLNWIIFRTLMTLPIQYMLQIHTFLFQCLGWKWCRRCSNGGGPGGPIPYRMYIDSGVVFLCTVALGPICPLLAPVSALYFLFCIPLLRRNCIFIYRPTFDAGGALWPFLADICLTSMIFAQVFLTVIMSLKEAVGPAVLSALPIVFVLAYRRLSRERFLRAYKDAALFQASLLDCWGSSFPQSTEKREEYRKFLVDAHKAAYVPICMALGETSCLTAHPAEVIPYDDGEHTIY